jgi:hypothetical protein
VTTPATSTTLALLGGPTTVTQDGPHFRWPPVTATTTAAVTRQLHDSISLYDRSGVIAELEGALESYHGRAHAVLASSGTAALHAMYAATLRPGDEVIVPAYTFFATVTPLLHLGVRPVLADCDANGNLDPAYVQSRITSRTRAIVVTHLWGIPADMAALGDLAQAGGLHLFEDASHAHGAQVDQPDPKQVIAEARPSAIMYETECPRGDSITRPVHTCNGQVCMPLIEASRGACVKPIRRRGAAGLGCWPSSATRAQKEPVSSLPGCWTLRRS